MNGPSIDSPFCEATAGGCLAEWTIAGGVVVYFRSLFLVLSVDTGPIAKNGVRSSSSPSVSFSHDN